jgi:hypothetical protein
MRPSALAHRCCPPGWSRSTEDSRSHEHGPGNGVLHPGSRESSTAGGSALLLADVQRARALGLDRQESVATHRSRFTSSNYASAPRAVEAPPIPQRDLSETTPDTHPRVSRDYIGTSEARTVHVSRPERKTLPGSSPVRSVPPRTTSVPFTITCATPVGTL